MFKHTHVETHGWKSLFLESQRYSLPLSQHLFTHMMHARVCMCIDAGTQSLRMYSQHMQVFIFVYSLHIYVYAYKDMFICVDVSFVRVSL